MFIPAAAFISRAIFIPGTVFALGIEIARHVPIIAPYALFMWPRIIFAIRSSPWRIGFGVVFAPAIMYAPQPAIFVMLAVREFAVTAIIFVCHLS
jgi:hypothetical protein